MRIYLFNTLAEATHLFSATTCAAPGHCFRLGACEPPPKDPLAPQLCGCLRRTTKAWHSHLWGAALICCLAQAAPARAEPTVPGIGTDFGLGAALSAGIASAQALHTSMTQSFGHGAAPVILTGGALSLNGNALQQWQDTISSLYGPATGTGGGLGTSNYAVQGPRVPHGMVSIDITPSLGGGAGASAVAHLTAPGTAGTLASIETRSFSPETPAGNRIEMHAFSPTAEGGIFVAMALDGDTKSTTALGLVYDRQGVALTGVGNPDQTRVTTRLQERNKSRAQGLRLGLRRDSAHGWAAVGWVAEGWSGVNWQEAGRQRGSLHQDDWGQEGWTLTPRIGLGQATTDSRSLLATSYGIVPAATAASARSVSERSVSATAASASSLPEVTLSRHERLRSKLSSVTLGGVAQRDIGNGWSLSIGVDLGRGRMRGQMLGIDGVGIDTIAARGSPDPEQQYRAMTWLGNVSLGLSRRVGRNTEVGFEVFADHISNVPTVVTRITGGGGSVTGGATGVGFSGAGEQNYTRTLVAKPQSGLGVGISFVHRF